MPASNDAESSEAERHWQILYAGLDPMEVIFSPAATHAEVTAIYPGATIEPLREQPIQPAAPPQEDAETVFARCSDDRRPCTGCANLATEGNCLAATRGELSYVASRKYSPVPDLPKRCECHQPMAADPDQRTGVERRPFLVERPSVQAEAHRRSGAPGMSRQRQRHARPVSSSDRAIGRILAGSLSGRRIDCRAISCAR
jgi:hypothetical protein